MEEKKRFFNRHQSLTAIISVLASVAAVAGFVYGATTIGTNISVDGTLTTTGASTLTGNVSAGGTLAVTGASTFSTTTVQGSFNTGAITATGTAASVFNNLTITGVCTGCSNAFAYPFTPTSNLGLIMSATTTNIFASGAAGFYASSSSMFASTTVQGSFNTGAITATGTAASSFNNFVVNASSTHIGTTNVSGALIAGNQIGLATTTPSVSTLLGVAGDAFISGSGTTTLLIKSSGSATRGNGTCIEVRNGDGVATRLYVNPGNTLTIEAGSCK